ncbi:MAG: sulfurtransferase [Alphaproteobacteria bacterium]|nr:MAG: sulfurtransferase [Alphaproteobacteria bacterium]
MTLIGSRDGPLVVDVRRHEVFAAAPQRIAGAIWRDHMHAAEWYAELGAGREIVVYCAHGHNVSEIAATRLAACGARARVLDGGIEAYQQAGGLLVARERPGVDVAAGASVWVTRQRPKIDRIACPWLIRRFIDPLARFHFVASEWVRDVAEEIGAIPYDVDGVPYSHRGEQCSFDTLIEEFGLKDEALARLARIVRGADTARLDLEPQAAGLLAVSLGLSAIEVDDLRQLEQGMLVYDALYGWCRFATAETHNWPARVA